MHGDPVQPGERRCVASETVEVPPGLDESVLCRLVDVTVVAKEPRQKRADPPFEQAHEILECRRVPGLRSQQQIAFVGVGHVG